MTTKDIANLIPMAHSLAIASENVKVAKKKKVRTEDMVGLGVKNLVGVGFVKLESDLIASL